MSRSVALTGGIASGKSLVADELARLGAVIIDADLLAREVVEPGTDGLAALRERFGDGILQPDGSLDRTALANIIFADPEARSAVNAIIHPRVRAQARKLEDAAPAGAVVVHVIPLLVEAGLAEAFETVWVVDIPVETQLARLMTRNGLTEAQAQARIDAQASREDRLAVADAVIDNSGSPSATLATVRTLWEMLTP